MEISLSHAHRALVALALISAVIGHTGQANADAISDAKRITGAALGIKPSDFANCTIFTKSDAERVFRAPVVHVETELDKDDCAHGLA